MKAYKLPDVQYRVNQTRWLKHKKQPEAIDASYAENDVIVEIEMKSKYLCI